LLTIDSPMDFSTIKNSLRDLSPLIAICVIRKENGIAVAQQEIVDVFSGAYDMVAGKFGMVIADQR